MRFLVRCFSYDVRFIAGIDNGKQQDQRKKERTTHKNNIQIGAMCERLNKQKRGYGHLKSSWFFFILYVDIYFLFVIWTCCYRSHLIFFARTYLPTCRDKPPIYSLIEFASFFFVASFMWSSYGTFTSHKFIYFANPNRIASSKINTVFENPSYVLCASL